MIFNNPLGEYWGYGQINLREPSNTKKIPNPNPAGFLGMPALSGAVKNRQTAFDATPGAQASRFWVFRVWVFRV